MIVAGAVVALGVTLRPHSEKRTYQIKVPNLGTLVGYHRPEIVQFFGIPYAKKPKRFQHAEYPPESWSGERDASERLSKSYPICPQNCYETSQAWIPDCPSYKDGYQSENCLFLEITVPERLIVEDSNQESGEGLKLIKCSITVLFYSKF